MIPLALGGLPAPSFQPRLKGRNQEGLAAEVGAELDLAFVRREVGDAAAQLEQLLARVAVPLILLDRVVDCLLGEAVLQLEGEDRQAVDEQPDVERPLGFVAAVAKLPGDREAVLFEALLRFRVVGRRGAVEQVEVVGPVPDAVAQHVDGAALADLPLEPGQEPAARGAGLGQIEGLRCFGLGRVEKGGELSEIDAVFAVVVVEVAAGPTDSAVAGRGLARGGSRKGVAGMAGQGCADEALEAALGGVGGPNGHTGLLGLPDQSITCKTVVVLLVEPVLFWDLLHRKTEVVLLEL